MFLKPRREHHQDEPHRGWVDRLLQVEAELYEPSQEEDGSFRQVGGHSAALVSSGGGRLKKQWNAREQQFYEEAAGGAWPLRFLPQYYGGSGEENCIVIQNLLEGFQNPCVMDLKLGVRTSGRDADWLKSARMSLLDHLTSSSATGVRLEGISVHQTLERKRITGGKHVSHLCTLGDSLEEIFTFFLTDTYIRTDIANIFLERIQDMLDHFQRNRRYHFTGTSLLLYYDNNNSASKQRWYRALHQAGHLRSSLLSKMMKTKADVKMIDFAHVEEIEPFSDFQRDEGFIMGLKSIKKALLNVLASKGFDSRFALTDVLESAVSGRLSGLSGPLAT